MAVATQARASGGLWAPLRLRHPVETYGLRLETEAVTVSLISCTA
jgi:hypothetical protein